MARWNVGMIVFKGGICVPWQLVATLFDDVDLIKYENGMYFAGGNDSGGPFFATSSNGYTWTVGYITGFSQLRGSVTYNGTQFLHVVDDGFAYKSTDGFTWTTVSVDPFPTSNPINTSNEPYNVGSNGTSFVIVGENGANLDPQVSAAPTADGPWTAQNVGGQRRVFASVATKGSTYYIGGNNASGTATPIIYKSTNNGITWTPVTPLPNITSIQNYCHVWDGVGTSLIMTDDPRFNTNGFWMTPADGQPWTNYQGYLPFPPSVWSVRAVSHDEIHYIVTMESTSTGESRIAFSTDLIHWSVLPRGVDVSGAPARAFETFYIGSNKEDVLVVGGYYQQFSTDNTFLYAINLECYGPTPETCVTPRVAFPNVTPEVLKFTNGLFFAHDRTSGTGNGVTYISTDGYNWSSFTTTALAAGNTRNSFATNGAGTSVYVASTTSTFISTNYSTWSALGSLSFPIAVVSTSVDSNGTAFVTVGKSTGSAQANVARSTGGAWSSQNVGGNNTLLTDVAVSDSGNFYISGANTVACAPLIYKSIDHGVSWTTITPPPITTQCSDIGNSVNMRTFAGPDGTLVLLLSDVGTNQFTDLWVTTDDGANWTDYSASVPALSGFTDWSLVAVDRDEAGRWVLTQTKTNVPTAGLMALHYTTDFINWTSLGTVQNANVRSRTPASDGDVFLISGPGTFGGGVSGTPAGIYTVDLDCLS